MSALRIQSLTASQLADRARLVTGTAPTRIIRRVSLSRVIAFNFFAFGERRARRYTGSVMPGITKSSGSYSLSQTRKAGGGATIPNGLLLASQLPRMRLGPNPPRITAPRRPR